MKKFTFKGVLDGFRSSVSQQVKPDQEIAENLRSDHFQVKKTFRHGFPFTPTAIAFDPIQHLLAIGSITGSLRILGRPGVDVHVKHEGGSAVIQLQFLINEGALISATADDTVHLWNFRQKIPQVVQSLKFQRERITCMHLPLQSKWLYVGTERGNIHILHIESFVLSGYVVNWNKAIEVSRKTHPGAVVHLSDNPLDPSKMLIGYESGQIVLWDLRTKNADYRCQTDEPLHSISWHHEGKQFICSHTDGSLSTWGLRQLKPIIVTHPHAKTTEDGELEACKPIHKVEWKLSKSGEAYIIFSGGLAYDTTGRTPSITVIQGKTTTVLEMEHNVVDFITLCESPWTSDFQEPYAVVVLLHNDLVVIDLLTAGFPCFENPYPMDIHESPVTCCAYFADCPSDLVPAFYSVGSKSQKRTGFSEREWPICGGEWSPTSSSYNEIIITGHADGSLKFWDASAGSLQVLYKLKTAKLFEKIKAGSLDAEDDPLAIQLMYLCPESRKLAIAGSSRHVVLFKFKKVEAFTKVSTLEIPIISETAKASQCSPDYEYAPRDNLRGETGDDSRNISSDYNFPLKVKGGMQKRAPGFQPTIVCLTPWNNGEQPENITALSLNSSCGLMAYGNESGLVIVDILQNVALLIMSTPDLYSSTDLYQRTLRSPKRHEERRDVDDKARSPSIDQINGVCVSPTAGKVMQELGRSDGSDSGDCSCLGSSGSAGGDGDACGNSNINGSGSGSMPLRRPAHEPIRHSRSQDKLESSFTRSRSSSMSSLENITMETISCLAFADSYTKKNDSSACPTLWIGTSEGAVLTVVFNAFSCGEQRHTQPVIVSTNSGSMFKLEGCVLTMSFLDCNGGMIPYSYESWKDDYLEGKDRNKSQTKSGSSRNPTTPNAHPTTGDGFEDRQFVVITSEKQARVVALPSQNCVYRQQLADTNIVVKAEITSLNESQERFASATRAMGCTFHRPRKFRSSQSPMNFAEDLSTFIETPLYRQSNITFESTNVEFKAAISSELTEMMGDIFIGQDMPEPPKESFFKGLFGGGPRGLDREELFGESSGRASRTVAKHIPGPYGNTEGFRERISSATGDVSHAHQMVIERGDKLSQLEERTARMMLEAENFSQSAHGLMLKYKDKKWYQL